MSIDPLSIFIYHSQQDEAVCKDIKERLRPLEHRKLVTILPRAEESIDNADIILFLVSSSFIGSEYICNITVTRAMARQASGEARVIPIILSDCDWRETAFARLQALPRFGATITDFRSREEGLNVVAEGIREVIHFVQAGLPAESAFGRSDAVTIYCSYSHKDRELLRALETHLAGLRQEELIDDWHDGKILAGDDWAHQIHGHISTAQIILLLVSPDYLASDWCRMVDVPRAMERHESGGAQVIPIILSDCDWHAAAFAKLQALPRFGEPITRFDRREAAFNAVTAGIVGVIHSLQAGQSARPPGFQASHRVSIYYSYSNKDRELLRVLETHLAGLRREELIDDWHDGRILAGDDWAHQIHSHISTE